MQKPLAVLNIEDSESDSDLIARLLKKAGYKVTFKRVETAVQMRAALKKRAWDVIISDHSLPQFDSYSALTLLREAGLDIPFLVVSGAIGEEAVVEMMKAGAHDFLIKDNLIRLIPAVERELEYAKVRRERKQTDNALSASEIRFRALIENSLDDISLLTADGTLIWESPSVVRNLDYTPNEVLGRNIFELMHPDDLEPIQSLFAQLIREPGGRQSGAFRLSRKDGTWRWIEAIATNMLNEPSVQAIVINYRDVTEQWQAKNTLRENEDRYRDLVENSQDLICTHNMDGLILSANPASARILGYEPGEFIGRNLRDFLIPEGKDHFKYYLSRLSRRGSASGLLWVQTKSGERRIWEYQNTVRSEGVAEPVVRGMARDITERKRSEEALNKTRSDYQRLFNHANDVILIFEAEEEIILDVNAAACAIYGFSRDELIGMSLKKLTLNVTQGEAQIRDTLENRSYRDFESIHINKNGQKIYFLINSSVVEYQNKEAILSINHDITERKQAEEVVRDSESRYRSLFEDSPIALWEEDFSAVKQRIEALREQGVINFQEYFTTHRQEVIECAALVKVLDINNAALKLYGANKKDDLLSGIAESIKDEPIQQFQNELVNIAEGRISFGWEEIIKKMDGSLRNIDLSWRAARDHENSLSRVIVSMTDITERKHSEEALRESEERFRSLFNRMMDGVYRSKHEGKFVDVNLAMVKIFGYSSREEMLAVDIKNELYFEPEERGNHILDTGQEEMDVYRMRRKDGSEIWVEDHGSYVHDEQGNIIYHEGILRDITDRKRADQALAESEARFRQAIAAADAIPYSLNYGSDHYTFIGSGITKLAGYSAEEMTPALLTSLIVESIMHGNFEGVPLDNAVKLVREGNSGIFWRCDHRIRTRSGEERWISDSSVQVLGENNIPTGSIGIIQDITERKQIEAAAREGEARYRSLFEDSPISLWEQDFSAVKLRLDSLRDDGIQDFRAYFASHPQMVLECVSLVKINDVNQAALRLFGAKSKADLFQNLSGFLNHDSAELFQNELISIAQGKTRFEGEGVTQTMNGRQIIIGLSLSVIPGYEDTFSKVIISMVDITARIQAEKIVRESEKSLRESQMIAGLGSYTLDIPTQNWTSSQILNQIFGIDETYNHSVENWVTVIHPDWQKEMSDYLAIEVMGNHIRFDKEYKIVRKNDGAERWVHGLGELEFNAQNQPVKMRGTIQDITGRKLTEIEIKERTDDMELINALNEAINRGENLDSIIKLFAERLVQAFGSYATTFYLPSPDGTTLVLQNIDLPHATVKDIERLIGRSIPQIEVPIREGSYFHRVIHSEHGLLTTDTETIHNWIEGFTETKHLPKAIRGPIRKLIPQINKLMNIRSLISIPLVSEKKIIALFDVSSSKILTQKDLNRIQKISNQLTAVILRKQADEQLLSAREFLQSVQDALSANLSILDHEGNIVDVNSGWRNFGIKNGQAHPNHCIGMNYLEVCDSAKGGSKEEASLVANGVREVLAGKQNEISVEYPCHAPGEQRWFVARITSFENNGQRWIVVAHENITERKQVEQALQHAEIKYRMLVERLPVIIYTSELGENGAWTYVSPQIENLLGFTAEEWMADPGLWYQQTHPEDRNRQQKLEEQAWARQESFEGEYRMLTRDGRQIWIRDSALILPPQNNRAPIVQGMFMDITERKQAEENLRDSEQRYRALFEDMPVAIWEEDFSEAKKYLNSLKAQGVTDLRTYFEINPDALYGCAAMIKVRDVNQATQKMYRAASKEELYKSMDVEVNESELEHIGTALIAIYEGKTSHSWEGTDETVTGEPIEISLSWSVAPGHEDDFSKVIVTTIDVTERKQAELALQTSEKRFRSLISSAGDLIVVIDPNGVIQYASPSSERILGYTPDEAIGVNFTEWIHPADFPEVLNSLAKVLDEPGVTFESIQGRGRHKDGSWHILDTIGTNLINEPAIQGIVLNIRDVTERKIAEEALRASEAQFRAIFEGAGIGIVLVDLLGHPVKENSVYQELLGFDAQELRSMVFTDFTHPEDAMKDWNLWQEQIAGSLNSYQIEKRIIHKSGRIIWVRLTSSTVPDSDGTALFGVRMLEDITERKKAEVEIKYQLAELEVLYENGLAINSLLEPKAIAQRMVEVIDQKLAWHHAAIRLYDAATDRLELVALHIPELGDAQIAEQILRINQAMDTPDKGLSGWVIRHGEIVRVGKLKDEPRYYESYPGINSGLYVPIKSGNATIGVITIESEQENAFTERDERTVLTLANQAAISFVNARLYVRLQKELEERHRAEEEIYKLNSELEQRVEERTAQIDATKHRLELAAQAGQIGVWEYTPRENKVIWDEHMHLIYQIPQGEFTGDPQEWAQLIHPDDLAKSQINTLLAFTQKLLLNNEYRVILSNGAMRYISSSAITVFSEDGIPERIIGINMDITERKQVEQSLRESENYVRLLFDAVPDPVSVTDANGLIVDINRAFEERFGTTRDESRGKLVGELGIFPQNELEKRDTYVNDILHGQKIKSVELEFYAPGDRIHTLELHSYLLKVNGRELVLNTSHDITAHKKAAETQRLAKSEMERALRIKNEFLANMSHELRTPLNSILGISESLEEQIAGALNEKQLKYIGTVRESGRHLLDLINDILDLSKVEAGRMVLDIHHIYVDKLCDASLRMIKEQAQKKSLNISYQNNENIKIVLADERRLKQALVNLLINAVKFTPPGARIGLEVSGNREANEIEFTVWDRGIGIAKEDIQQLFKPFVQLDAGLAREFQGTGLGLALVAQMVQLQGGRVRVESEVGAGSRFIITLPWALNEQTPKAKVTAELKPPVTRSDGKRGGKILLVEDTDVVIQLMSEYLRYKGYEVILAHNGLEGIKLAEQERPDLILMDVMMPIMNGLEATEKLRTDESFKDTPIIALTALAMQGDKERCLAAGMNDYLSKPIQMQDLADMIEKYMRPA